MKTSKRKMTVQYVSMPDEEGNLAEPEGKMASEAIMIDDYEMTICGLPDAVARMKTWIQAALRKVDYKELLRPFFHPTKNGESVQFPLIGEEVWRITVKR